MTTVPLLEVRLLGRVAVRRRDRSHVALSEWPTGRCLDLLRLLAVHAGRSVGTHRLAGSLWPDAASWRATSSLLETATQLRTVLGDGCIERAGGTMALRHAWVDVVQAKRLMVSGGEAMAGGRPREVVARARSVARLYRGDFHADDDASAWASGIREELSAGRLRLFDDAGRSCLVLGEHREALAYAHAVLRREPEAESANRTKMCAHVELGERGLALQAFERYRRRLDADPTTEPSAEMVALRRRMGQDAARR